MSRRNFPILIMAEHGAFRERLRSVACELGKVWEAGDVLSALETLTVQPFRLLLLDWRLMKNELPAFEKLIDTLQPDAVRLALFQVPQLPQVLAAMKWGMMDVLWAAQEVPDLRRTILEAMAREKKDGTAHQTVTYLAETLADHAVGHRTTLFRARRDFSRAFLSQILNRQGVERNRLADVMKVSSRTLQRYLAN
ncbi:MAG TPA: hypothetical protein VHE12_09595 [bacterium]|nr:hypothetical protein [bacterium]